MMVYIKMGLVVTGKIFQNCILKYFQPCDLLTNQKHLNKFARLFSENVDAQHMVKDKDQSQ